MTPANLRHRAEYVSYRATASALRRLPQPAVRAWGRRLGRLVHALLRERRQLALANLERALPGLSPDERRRIARASFEEHTAFFLEALWASRLEPREILERFEVEGEEHLEQALSLGKGLFVLTGHYGYWEFAAYPLEALVGKLHILIRPQSNPLVERELEAVRERTGHILVPRRKSGHRMLNLLRRGATVALAIDQRVRPVEGLLVPFLGYQAWTSSVPAYLATVTGAPAVPIFCLPLEGGRYRLTIDPPIPAQGRGQEEVFRLTRRYLEPLEREIRRHPEQWFWPHSRWQRIARYRRPDAIERLRRTSGLPERPATAGLEALPLDYRESLRRLEDVVDDTFLEQARHVFLEGDGALTTPLVVAFGHRCVDRGHPVLYTSADRLVARLDAAASRAALASKMRELDSRALVLVDGADPRRLTTAEIDRLALFLEHRGPRGSLLLASPAGAAEWKGALARASVSPEQAWSLFAERGRTLLLPPPRDRSRSTIRAPAAEPPH